MELKLAAIFLGRTRATTSVANEPLAVLIQGELREVIEKFKSRNTRLAHLPAPSQLARSA